MPTYTPRLGLSALTPADNIDWDRDFAANFRQIDGFPGLLICKSDTHPNWGAAHKGMWIYELDTNLHWQWNGTQFIRPFPLGLLNNPAIDRLNADQTNSASGTTYGTILQANVLVPSGGRSIEVTISFSGITNNTSGVSAFRIVRGPGPVVFGGWYTTGKNPAANASEYMTPKVMTITDTPTGVPPLGLMCNYQLQIRAETSGTAILRANPNAPCVLKIKEI